jgi:hypothetical protein
VETPVGIAFTDSHRLIAQGAGAPISTVTLEVASAADAANVIHAFLTTEVTAEILKLRPEKFSIKAQIFGPSWEQCILKVRVYQSAANVQALAVEFSRRSGDGLTFARTFAAARQRLQDRFGAQLVDDQLAPQLPESVPSPPPTEWPGERPSALLRPLLDAVRGGTAPVEVEAVAALAVFASTGCAVLCAACIDMGLDVAAFLADLLASKRLEVIYPAAHLALQLAPHACNGAPVGRGLAEVFEGNPAMSISHLARNELVAASHTIAAQA